MRSDWQCVVLDRIRITINLLKKSHVLNSPSTAGGESVLSILKELQNDVRYDRDDASTPKMVVGPFLQILRSRSVSAPFILSAIETLQMFIENKVLLTASDPIAETLDDIIDAATNCKFIHTNPEVDTLAQRQLVGLLRSLVLHHPTAAYLSLDSLWRIFDFANSTMIATGGISKVRVVFLSAEAAIVDLVDYLLLSVSSGTNTGTSEKQNSSTATDTQQRSEFDTITAMCWFLAHFVSVMNGYCSEEPDCVIPPPPPMLPQQQSPGVPPTGMKHFVSNPSPRPSTPIAFGKSPSQPQQMNDGANETDTAQLRFCMTMVRRLLLAHGCTGTIKKLMISSSQLSTLVSDTLGSSLLLLCSTRRSAAQADVMHSALVLFSVLVNSMGTSLRILVERFVRQVYVKALIQVHEWFSGQVASSQVMGGYPFPYVRPAQGDAKSSSSLSLDAPATSPAVALEYITGFRTDVLEIILESLCDLMSDLAFIPSLYVSFDCSPTALDVVQPMVDYLCKSCCLVLTHSAELMTGNSKEIGILVIQVFKQLSMALSARVAGRDKLLFEQTYLTAVTPQSTSPSRSETEAIAASNGSGSHSPGATVVMGDSSGSKAIDAVEDIAPAMKVAQIMKACRQSKCILGEAARLFTEKPEKSFRFLQALGALPTPLTAVSVAKFLRIAPNLPKNLVGSFLGELGVDNPNHESKSKTMHSDVLLAYVSSFGFNQQPTLDCLRTFLSAFRLPGEAQQIDRILVAFSEFCHAHSLEGISGLLQNSEVTYLLTFSMIMLNTDRHNPNIRDDRRMTKEQFVRNNTNYGRDVNQTIPIPREYLESVFHSIDKNPIRTEEEKISSFATSEEWMDYQMQAARDPRKSIMIATEFDEEHLNNLAADFSAASGNTLIRDPQEAVQQIWSELCSSVKSQSQDRDSNAPVTVGASVSVDASAVLKKLLVEDHCPPSIFDPLELCAAIREQHWIFDCDLMSCVWKHLLRVSTCVHIHHYLVMVQIMRIDAARDQEQINLERVPPLKKGQLRRLLDISNEFLFDLLKVANGYNLHYIIDYSGMLLVSCTGLMAGELCEKIFKQLLWDPSSVSSAELDGVDFPFLDVRSAVTFDPTLLLQQLYFFESVRSAMVTALTLVHEYQASVRCWGTIIFFLSCLHDSALLPEDMVIEPDSDLLPPHVRDEFEMKLLELERKRIMSTRPTPSKRSKKSSSILSLQGLGEALFGSASEVDGLASLPNGARENDVASSSTNATNTAAVIGAEDMSMEEMLVMKLDALSARWDAGYEQQQQGYRESEESKGLRSASYESVATQDGAEQTGYFSVGDAVKEIRAHSARSGIVNLVSGTRFLSENKLKDFMKALIRVAEVKDSIHSDLVPWSEQSASSSTGFIGGTESYSLDPLHYAQTAAHVLDSSECFNRMVLVLCNECESAVNASQWFSTSSIAWLEMLLVEVSLRNRDRFNLVWPFLRDHYIRGLSGRGVQLSYVTERRITGLLKISTRLIAREVYASQILELLGNLFANSSSSSSSGSKDSPESVAPPVVTATEASCTGDSSSHFPPIAPPVLVDLSNQVAAGMWSVLTLNVERLPLLSLEQWQTIFNIIALGAAAGNFAAIKSFEAMAWLLHEPRLIAKVPVFCIIGIKPLLRNSRAPLSVSIGAVHLLSHLHSRMEVLIKDGSEEFATEEFEDSNEPDADIPILWESCWTPILRALVEGVSDLRPPVQEACLDALCQAVLDKHCRAVPARVLIDVLGDVFAPVILKAGDLSLARINRELPRDAQLPLAAQIQEMHAGRSTEPTEQQQQQPAIPTQLPDWLMRGTKGRNSLEYCLSTLCTSFKTHLKKLSSYPSFDKLWLRLLSIFGYLIEVATNIRSLVASAVPATSELSTEVRNSCCTVHKMLDVAKEKLKLLFTALKKEGIFQKRPGLLSVSNHTIGQFRGCANIIE